MCGSELKTLPEPVQRVMGALQAHGHPHAAVMLDNAARTAQHVVMVTYNLNERDDVAVLVVTSGDRRVDEQRVAALVCSGQGKLGRADAEFVKSRTGFSIGGVAPIAHRQDSVTLIDRDLFRFDEVWAAVGHANAVFMLSPAQLQAMTGAPVVDVVESAVPT